MNSGKLADLVWGTRVYRKTQEIICIDLVVLWDKAEMPRDRVFSQQKRSADSFYCISEIVSQKGEKSKVTENHQLMSRKMRMAHYLERQKRKYSGKK